MQHPSVASSVSCEAGSAMCLAAQGIPLAIKCTDNAKINVINTEDLGYQEQTLEALQFNDPIGAS